MTTRLFLLAALALPIGCTTSSSDDDGQFQASGGVGASTTQAMYSAASSGPVAVASVFILAQYGASDEQKAVAIRNARRALAKIESQPEKKKKTAVKKEKTRYIAVDTARDQRAKGTTSVMIFDTHSEEIVGNEVYDVAYTPPVGQSAPYDTYAATYVGSGA